MAKDTVRISIEATRNHIGKSSMALIVAEGLRNLGFDVVFESNDAVEFNLTKEVIEYQSASLQELFKAQDVEVVVSDKDKLVRE